MAAFRLSPARLRHPRGHLARTAHLCPVLAPLPIMAKHTSVWRDAHEQTPHPQLPGDLTTDVCVIGAGIASISAAVEAALANLHVVVLEAASVGGGETSATSAHLTNVFDAGFRYVERHSSLETTRLAANGHMAAISRIDELSKTHGIDSRFRRVPGYLFAHDASANGDVVDELVVAQRCNEPMWRPERLADSPIGPRGRTALRFPNQGIFRPLAYLHGLVDVLQTHGGALFELIVRRDVQGRRPPEVDVEREDVV